MTKKIILSVILLLFFSGILFVWKLIGPATAFEKEKYNLYIKTGMNYNQVIDLLKKDTVLKNPGIFELIAKKLDYPNNVKAGKYEIRKNMSLLDIARILRNGKQLPVNLVITKIRTKEDLASLIGKKLECDSLSIIHFLNNNDTLKRYGLDSNTVMTTVFPNTYTFFWNSNPSKVFKKFRGAYQGFWTEIRKKQASAKLLNPTSTYILASIVEEETNKKEDKSLIASTYLNRISKGMKLSADPTIKYAMRNFELKRIYHKYLDVESPYNTYKYVGLPPGPICTPSEETIDAVLTAPKTNYIYFVAKSDFSGYSNFAEDYSQHMKYAKEYQKALDSFMAAKKQPAK